MTHPMVFSSRRRPDGTRAPLKERIAALRVVPRLVRLVWETKPSYAAAMLVLRLVRAVVPLASLWVAKLIIDEVLLLARTHGPSAHLWSLVALEMATVVGGELLARCSGLVEGLLGDLFTNRISIQSWSTRRRSISISSRIRRFTIISSGRGRARPAVSHC